MDTQECLSCKDQNIKDPHCDYLCNDGKLPIYKAQVVIDSYEWCCPHCEGDNLRKGQVEDYAIDTCEHCDHKSEMVN